MAGLTYDSGALIAAERGDRRLWSLHARALGRGVIPVVPAGVLAEVWRGGPASHLSRVLGGCAVDDLDTERARAAGRLLAGGPPAIETVDATVVESALRHGNAVVTANRLHLSALARAAGRRLAIIDC